MQGKRRPGCWRSLSDSSRCSSCLMTRRRIGRGGSVQARQREVGIWRVLLCYVNKQLRTGSRASRSILTSEMVGARDAASRRCAVVLCNVNQPKIRAAPCGEKRVGEWAEGAAADALFAAGAKTRMQRVGDADVTLVFFNNPDEMQPG